MCKIQQLKRIDGFVALLRPKWFHLSTLRKSGPTFPPRDNTLHRFGSRLPVTPGLTHFTVEVHRLPNRISGQFHDCSGLRH